MSLAVAKVGIGIDPIPRYAECRKSFVLRITRVGSPYLVSLPRERRLGRENGRCRRRFGVGDWPGFCYSRTVDQSLAQPGKSMTPPAIKPFFCRLLLCLLVIAAGADCASAQQAGQREPTLGDRLKAGLQARRPSEIAFVTAVVETVGRGELREDLVNRVFFWARSRRGRSGKRRPIIYFQPALQRIAKQGGVRIRSNLDAIASAGT